jgi:hypothetical protein
MGTEKHREIMGRIRKMAAKCAQRGRFPKFSSDLKGRLGCKDIFD